MLAKSQHRFCKESCITNLLEFFEGVNKQADEGDPVDTAYLDFQKDFDRVLHQRLISKVCSHSVRGKVSSWICNWVKQRLEINGQFSLQRVVKGRVSKDLDWNGCSST